MLTRFVRIQLIIFSIASIIGIIAMVLVYIQVPTLLGIGRMTVTLELPAEGGLYRFANVTYRGIQVGKVTAVGLTDNGAKATLSLATSPKIPADLRAEVRSISAVGEQYVDLRPQNGSPPFLRNGSVIPMQRTTIPQPVGPMLDRTSALVDSIPQGKISALLDESFKGLNGSGYDLGSLFDSAAKIAGSANASADRTRALIDDSRPLLDSQAQTTDSIRRWARSVAGVAEQVATDDNQVRTLLQNGSGAADEAARLFDQVKLTLPVLLANLTTIGQIGVTYRPSLEQLLVLFPPLVAFAQATVGGNNYIGLPASGFHISISDPIPCTVGFLPPSQWRSPADTTTIDTPDGLYCKLPQDSPLAVRGARNYPCMGHPGKRAPTVQICDSDKPFMPMAMREHFAGPYPLDPNLLSQGVPPDDRIRSDSNIFGPVEGTPLPPPQNAPPPPKLPRPPSMEPLGPGIPGRLPGAQAPGDFSAPVNSPASPATTPPAGSPGSPASLSPLGPLAPLDTPDSSATPSASPPAGGRPSAAPSSFSGSGSGAKPSITFAEYNPRTGSYVGSDGQMSRQTDLISLPDHTAKTWQDLILK
jgi:phospholipid/cholesterol/gamma-HCH transport system substrate-binding protein